jgi:hypothetical protein
MMEAVSTFETSCQFLPNYTAQHPRKPSSDQNVFCIVDVGVKEINIYSTESREVRRWSP